MTGGKLTLTEGTFHVGASGTTWGGAPYNVAVVIDKANVLLEGCGDATLIYLDNDENAIVIGVADGCHGCHVTRLKVDGNYTNNSGGNGCHGIATWNTVNNCSVTHCHVTNAYQGGISFGQGRGSIASDNIIEGCNDLGIQFWGHTSGKIHGNTIYDCRVGLGVFHDSHFCIVALNTVATTLEEGIFLDYTDGTYYPYENSIVHNTVYDAGTNAAATYGGIYCRNGCGDYNKCIGNTVISSPYGHAIDWYSKYAIIADNTIRGWPNNKGAIQARSDYQNVHHNIIDGEGTAAIGIAINGDYVRAEGNMVENCALYGIQINDCADAQVKNNTTLNNGTDIIETNSPTGSSIRGNAGFVTENSGTSTLVNGQTSIAVTHGLAVTPAIGDVMVTPIEDWGAATKFWISAYSSTTFTITVDGDPGQDVDFAWKAVVL